MRRFVFCGMMILMATAAIAVAQEAKTPAPAPMHIMTAPAELTWGELPPMFERGGTFTVVSGDPGKDGLYVVRAKLPAGYKIAPHWHPTDEHVTVLSGTFAMGMGDTMDKATMKELPAGGYGLMPATMHHYAMALTDVEIQVHGKGPFALTYVNPSDDPRQRAAKP